MLHKLFPKDLWKNLTIFSGLAGRMLEHDQHLVLVSKLHCTVSAAAETNYFQAANYILMRLAVTETSTVLLQAGGLVCRQVVLDFEIRASCTTGTKEVLSGYRPQSP